MSVEQLGERLKLKSHLLLYSVSDLIERGILEPQSLVDIGSLGWSRFTLLFNFDLETLKAKDRALEILEKDPRVAFLAETEGLYDYETSIVARSNAEAQNIFDEILEKAGITLETKLLLPRLHSIQYQRKYLASEHRSNEKLLLFSPAPVRPLVLDRKDEVLLRSLAQNPTLSLRSLAQQNQISATAVHARLQKLRDQKIFGGKFYSVHFEKYGARFYSLFLSLRSRHEGLRKRIYQLAERSLHCVHCVENLGVWDFEFGIEVSTADDLPQAKLELMEPISEFIAQTLLLSRVRIRKFVPFSVQIMTTKDSTVRNQISISES